MRIAFACPFYGNTHPLVGDSQRANIVNAFEAGHQIIDDYSVSGTQHRNACEAMTARAAKDDRVDAVFWTEHDVILPPFAIVQLAKTLEETPEADVATGIIFRRSPPYNPIISFFDPTFTEEQYAACRTHADPNVRRVAGAMPYEEMRGKMLKALNRLNTEEPPFPCDTASMGVTLYRRRVLERMAEIPDAFAIDPLGFFSIDSIFFMRVKEQGFKLYCNPKVLCGHQGDPEIIDWSTWRKHMTATFEKFDIEKQSKLRKERGPLETIYGELTRLANKYRTDKGTLEHTPASGWIEYTHNYCDFYQAHLEEIRLSAKRVLEVGVYEGASCRMWADYFPEAEVYGIDKGEDADPGFDRDEPGTRIHFRKGDGADREFLQSFVDSVDGPFDLIVDDASHFMADQQTTFGFLFRHLRPGGFYILEDLHTSYFGEAFGVEADGSNATVPFLEALALNRSAAFSKYVTDAELEYLKEHVQYVLLYGKRSMTSIIRKKG